MEEYLEPTLADVLVTSYEGDKAASDRMHGQGTCVTDNGCSYSGGFKDGLFSGKGVFTWVNGTIYDGNFSSGSMEGTGRYTWPDGSSYEGGIVNGLRSSAGIFKCSGGQIYDGLWKVGKRSGHGVCSYNEEKTIVYTGSWLNGLRHGFGTMKYESGDVYEGEWEFDRKCGRGVMFWKAADEVYVGDFKDDVPHGVGETIWGGVSTTDSAGGVLKSSATKAHCNIYRGSFKNGLRGGKGTLFYPNGSQYTGQWAGNQKHGEGVYVFSDGRIFCGLFYKDRMDEASMQSSSVDSLIKLMNPRVTEDVSSQFYVNIEDLIRKYPSQALVTIASAPSVSKVDFPSICNNTTKEIERIILRFNTCIKTTYKKISDLTVRRRARESNEVSLHDAFTSSLTTLEALLYTSRQFHRRIFCATLYMVKKFLREVDLLDGVVLNSYDINLIFEKMKIHHRNIAAERQYEYRNALFVTNRTKSQDAAATAAAATTTIATTISSLPAQYDPNPDSSSSSSSLIFKDDIFTADIDSLVNPSIFRGYYRAVSRNKDAGFPLSNYSQEGEDEVDEDDSSYTSVGVTNSVLDDPRFPILEREFVELLVRVIVERSNAVVFSTSNNGSGGITSPSPPPSLPNNNNSPSRSQTMKLRPLSAYPIPDLVAKLLSEKIQPLNADPNLAPSHVGVFYHDTIQDILKKTASVTKIMAIFSEIRSLSTSSSSTKRRGSKGFTIRIGDYVRFMLTASEKSEHLKGCLSDKITAELLLVASRLDTANSSDADGFSWKSSTLFDKVLGFDDFVYSICSVMSSKLWIDFEEAANNKGDGGIGSGAGTDSVSIDVAATAAAAAVPETKAEDVSPAAPAVEVEIANEEITTNNLFAVPVPDGSNGVMNLLQRRLILFFVQPK